jgi:DNA-directed RNA polymerase specialized sigma subunit
MTAKEYLMQAFQMKKKIDFLREEIQRLENAATSCTANITGMPHNPSPSNSRMADVILKLVSRKDELSQKITELEALTLEINYRISLLDREEYRTILYKRYIDGQEWLDIAVATSYAESYLYRLHKRALKAFEAILNKEDS